MDTVLFDFDGTLVEIDIDFNQMRQGIFSLGLEYGVFAEPGLYVLESLEDIFEKLRQLDVNQARDFKRRAKRLIVSIEVEAATRSRAMPGAKRTLRELKGRGIKIGIVTRNCRSVVIKSAETADFAYDLMLTRDDVEKVKPDPQHLLDALNIMASKPGESIMVGDHPMDILAGKRAGMKTAAVLTSKSIKDFEEVAPDLMLTGVADLLGIL
jgi:phosphoglycolate phosphatase